MLNWYAGIKRTYNKHLKKIPLKIRSWLVLTRPFTLLLPLIGGWILIQGSLGMPIITPDPVKTWFTLLALMLINAGGNLINASEDIEIDKINKPYRPTCTGLVTKTEAKLVGILCFGVSYLLSKIANPTFVWLCLLMMILTFCYSVPPIRIKKRFLWNNITQAVIRGFMGVLAAWCIYGQIQMQILAFGVILSTFIVSAQASKDISDLLGDFKHGVNTFPVVFGIEKTHKIMTRLAPAPFLLLIVFVLCKILSPMTLTTLILLPITLWIPKATAETKEMENSIGWIAFYITMLLFLLIFVLTTSFS